jgi:Holliday junction DNA helicase RuvA
MIAYLHGTLVEKELDHVILDVGGVGYEVQVSLNSYDALPPVGNACRLLVHDYLREDAHWLFGFADAGERDLFRMLIEVNGIGVKTACTALGGLPPHELQLAIANRDVKRLAKLPGVGKKTAERIVVELAGKVDPLEAMSAAQKAEGKAGAVTAQMRDAVLALVALGQPQEVALKRVQEIAAELGGDKLGVDEFVRKALQNRPHS